MDAVTWTAALPLAGTTAPLPTSADLSPAATRPSAVGSCQGDLPFGDRAYAPNGQLYAREIAPQNAGHIGIFDVATGKRLRVIETGISTNTLKGLAWAPDSQRLAYIYHEGPGGSITIANANTAKHVQTLSIGKWYHFTSGPRIRAISFTPALVAPRATTM